MASAEREREKNARQFSYDYNPHNNFVICCDENDHFCSFILIAVHLFADIKI